MSAIEINNLLMSVGIPEILDDPDALATLPAEKIEALLTARSMAAAEVEQQPENGALIDLLYTAHMALTSARYLHAVLAAGEPIEAPSPSDLVRLWSGSPLRVVDKGALADLMATTPTIDTLTKAGLPEEAEPYLQFVETPERLPDAEGIEAGEDDYASYFASYWKIGETENDDVICLDERADGVVVVLDRDWGFFAMQYVNASVAHLIVTLQAYADLLEHVDPKTLAEDYPNITVPEPALKNFISAIEAIDPGAMTEGSFWREEAEMLSDV